MIRKKQLQERIDNLEIRIIKIEGSLFDPSKKKLQADIEELQDKMRELECSIFDLKQNVKHQHMLIDALSYVATKKEHGLVSGYGSQDEHAKLEKEGYHLFKVYNDGMYHLYIKD